MGREFELKYAAAEKDLEILKAKYPHLAPIAMETTYYDSPDGRMGRLHWTFRRRMENEKSVCTLKVPLPDGSRGEWEAECGDIMESIEPLCAAGAPLQLVALTINGVEPVCGARFTRLAGMVEFPGGKAELALDKGVLTGGNQELPFAEVEVELKEGTEEAATAFAQALAREMGLKPEFKSKVARARALAGLK